MSKRELAWETRANHYMITRVLAELHRAGLVTLHGGPGGFRVESTDEGRAFVARQRAYIQQTFGPQLEAHFRYGIRPSWATFTGKHHESAAG
jgi:DNA-binding transcriptional regulator YhcF (GntR family)